MKVPIVCLLLLLLLGFVYHTVKYTDLVGLSVSQLVVCPSIRLREKSFLRIKEASLNGRCQTTYGGSKIIFRTNLHFKQITESLIPGAYVSALLVLVHLLFEEDKQNKV